MKNDKQRILDRCYLYMVKQIREIPLDTFENGLYYQLLQEGFQAIGEGITPPIFNILTTSRIEKIEITITKIDEDILINLNLAKELLISMHQGKYREILDIYEYFCMDEEKNEYLSQLNTIFKNYI